MSDGQNPISVYTQDQGIEDGILVDVSEWGGHYFDRAKRVVVTRSIWSLIEGEAANRRRLSEARGKGPSYAAECHTICRMMLRRLSGYYMVRYGLKGVREDLVETRATIGKVLPRVFLTWNEYEGVVLMLPEDY